MTLTLKVCVTAKHSLITGEGTTHVRLLVVCRILRSQKLMRYVAMGTLVPLYLMNQTLKSVLQ